MIYTIVIGKSVVCLDTKNGPWIIRELGTGAEQGRTDNKITAIDIAKRLNPL